MAGMDKTLKSEDDQFYHYHTYSFLKEKEWQQKTDEGIVLAQSYRDRSIVRNKP